MFQSQTNSSFTWDRFPVFRVTQISVLPTAEPMTTTDSDDDDLPSQASRFSGVAYRRDAAAKRVPQVDTRVKPEKLRFQASLLLFPASFPSRTTYLNPDRWCICRRYAMEGATLVDWDPQILSLALAALLPGPTCAKALEVSLPSMLSALHGEIKATTCNVNSPYSCMLLATAIPTHHVVPLQPCPEHVRTTTYCPTGARADYTQLCPGSGRYSSLGKTVWTQISRTVRHRWRIQQPCESAGATTRLVLHCSGSSAQPCTCYGASS